MNLPCLHVCAACTCWSAILLSKRSRQLLLCHRQHACITKGRPGGLGMANGHATTCCCGYRHQEILFQADKVSHLLDKVKCLRRSKQLSRDVVE